MFSLVSPGRFESNGNLPCARTVKLKRDVSNYNAAHTSMDDACRHVDTHVVCNINGFSADGRLLEVLRCVYKVARLYPY